MYILLIVYNFFCLFVHIENFIEDIFNFITRKSIGGGVHFNLHYIIFSCECSSIVSHVGPSVGRSVGLSVNNEFQEVR